MTVEELADIATISLHAKIQREAYMTAASLHARGAPQDLIDFVMARCAQVSNERLTEVREVIVSRLSVVLDEMHRPASQPPWPAPIPMRRKQQSG